MNIKPFLFSAVLTALALSMVSTAATAVERNRECLQEARAAYRDCRLECRSDFKIERDRCLNVDPECAEACYTDLETCVNGVLDPIDACKDECTQDLETGKQDCLAETTPAEKMACMAQLFIDAHLCMQDCREGMKEDLKGCRDAFGDCIDACPKAEGE